MPIATPVKTALTIAGSDPSGGAGIQADLKTFSRLRVYGMAVIAAMTAQNTMGVASVSAVSHEFVSDHLESVLSDIHVDAAKTGMLLTASVIEIVAQKLKDFSVRNLVVDPVMISSSGARLLDEDALATFRQLLMPRAALITPNLHEAGELAGQTVQTESDMEEAARAIHAMGPRAVLVKGGHLRDGDAVDVLFDGQKFLHLRSPRITTRHTHGTGCVLSAAIAAYLARGESLENAVRQGKDLVTEAIRRGLEIGRGIGPCDPLSLGG
jgi:hydroxymethylpyrimidine kinase/phosphomethylpyrimidine kinase